MQSLLQQTSIVDDIQAERARQSLRFGFLVAILNFVFWLAFYIVYDLSQLYFSAMTLVLCVMPYLLYKLVGYNAAAYTFFFSVFVFLIIASLYNPPTPEVVRSQHFFFLPLAIYAYALFYHCSLLFRSLLSTVSIVMFLYFSITTTSVVTPEQLGLTLEARRYATWFNVIVSAVGLVGMIHYVHEGIQVRETEKYQVNQAIFEEQLELFYQPQVDQFGNIIGAEALLRWKHPVMGVITPDKFIPYAEKTGSIVDIGKWVVNEACRQIAAWQAHPDLANLRLSVNISAREFQSASFVTDIESFVQLHQIEPAKLKIEITESVLLHDTDEAVAKINRLRKLGIQFSLDDFGTGYSTLSLIKRLPVSEIKIDREFVTDITETTQEMPVTDTLIALGESLHVDSVAEGIETREQWEYLSNKGCQYFQGYFFGKPMEINMFNQFAYLKRLGDI